MELLPDTPLFTSAGQRIVRERCTHPTGSFGPFPKSEIEVSVAARFEEIARRHPRRTAVKDDSAEYTYEALNRAANQVAHAILALDTEPGRPIGLLFPNGPEFVIASLGVLKAGRIQVPIDRWFPKARLGYMLEHSGAAAVLTDAANLGLARGICPVPAVDIGPLLRQGTDTNPDIAITGRSPVSVDYTSGSTGRPKGTARAHRSLMHAVMQLTNAFHVSPDDRILMCRPALRAYLYAILNGATYFPVDARSADLTRIPELLARAKITIYRSAVTTFRSWAETLNGREPFPDLRMISLYGEAVYHTDVCRYRRYFPDSCILSSSLGCSEFGDYAYFFADGRTSSLRGVLPGGYPVEDTEILILDADGRPVPPETIGEIAIRSRYGADGYWREPELTRKAFQRDAEDPEIVTYHTGDLGRRASDGCLFHLGRKDRQIKIRGHRVDACEVEAALLEMEGIQRSAVVGREDKPGELRLVAYIVPNGPSTPGAPEIRRRLAERFAEFMVPSAFIEVARLPLTDTGKVDVSALPAPGNSRPALGSQYVAPRNPLEKRIARIWEELLGVIEVGVEDSFLDLGGNSMLATRLIVRLRCDLNADLALRAIFDEPTVAGLARIVDASLR